MKQLKLNAEERLRALLNAPPEELDLIDRILTGRMTETVRASTELLTFSEAARRLKVGRSTVYRMALEGRLRWVPLRGNSRRIPASELDRIAAGVHRDVAGERAPEPPAAPGHARRGENDRQHSRGGGHGPL